MGRFLPGSGFILAGKEAHSSPGEGGTVKRVMRKCTTDCLIDAEGVHHGPLYTHREAGGPVYTPRVGGKAYTRRDTLLPAYPGGLLSGIKQGEIHPGRPPLWA